MRIAHRNPLCEKRPLNRGRFFLVLGIEDTADLCYYYNCNAIRDTIHSENGIGGNGNES